jgi:hypothetical protein
MEPMEFYFRERVGVDRADPPGLAATVSFPADLQGPPDTGHGGAVTAMLLELVRLYLDARGDADVLEAPVSMEVCLHRALPLDTAVQGEAAPGEGGWRSRLSWRDRPFAEATVRPAEEVPAPPEGVRAAWAGAPSGGELVPAYAFCLGCGVQNPRGAQVRFQYDDAWMWRSLAPQPHFRCQNGRLFPGYLAIVCDELGWWLGALRQGECGVSNRLSLTLAPAAHGVPLLALGPRRLVASVDPKGRMWRAETFILGADGQPIAAASVQFVGGPAFTRLMLPGFLSQDDRAAVERAFPRARAGVGADARRRTAPSAAGEPPAANGAA